MIDYVLHTYGINAWYATELVKDLSPEQMCAQPSGLVNHPCWNLGHLTRTAHHLCQFLGAESTLPASWDEKFKAGVPPDPDVAANPGKDELLAVFGKLHETASAALRHVDAATLAKENPDENLRKYFPTIGAQAVFMMTAHEMDHLGQVAAWRRAMGLPPAM